MKKIFKIIFVLIICIVLLFVSSYFFIVFDYEKSIEIPVGEKYEFKYKVESFFKDVSDEIVLSNNINYDVVGEYECEYKYTNLLNITKSKKSKVLVVDNIKPTITLNGEDVIYMLVNNDYQELGYNVQDNYDSDVEVIITGEINVNVPGVYYLKYTAKDSSGNKSKVTRKIIVREKFVVEQDIKKFNINDYFDDNVILSETEDMGDDYINKMVYVGDSVPWVFSNNYMWNPERVYAAPCTGPSNVLQQKVYLNNKLTNKTIVDLIEINKPEYILVSIGFCEIVSLGNVDKFIENYDNFINEIKNLVPSSKIILASIYPVINETLRGTEVPTNKQVNEYNYYTAYVAQKNNLKYLNYSEIVKNNEGLADKMLTMSDGYHPNNLGMQKIINYIKTHGYK